MGEHLPCKQGVRGSNPLISNKKFLVSMRLGETPVPIPNTMVKPYTADGTALATVWESRWMPDQTSSARDH